MKTSLLSILIGVLCSGAVAAETARTLENRDVGVTIDPVGYLTVVTKTDQRVWKQHNARAPFTNIQGAKNQVSFRTVSGSNALLVTVAVPMQGADVSFSVDVPDRGITIQNLFAVEPFEFASPTNAAVVVADYSDGHLYPLNLSRMPRAWWNLASIDMPLVGVCDLSHGHGYAVIVDTDEDAVVRLTKVSQDGHEMLLPQVGFQASKGTFRYTRRFLYHFSTEGGYVTFAKRFRQWANERGLIAPFSEKLKANPNISRLFGAPDVWGDASLKFAREAKAAGVEKMLIHGKASVADMKAINELGYLTSDYDNYTDIFQVEAGKSVDSTHGEIPGDTVLKSDGTRMKAWLTWDKKQYMKRCPQRWVPAAQIVVPKAIAERPYLGRFIDVTTAEDLYECYDSNHPLTRLEKRQCGVDLLRYVRSLGLVTGGEHGRYWAVPNLDYIEGMQSGGFYSWPSGWLKRPKTKDEVFENPHGGNFGKWSEYEKWGIGPEFRVPLWELVFHDCVVSTWYWGDSSDFLLQAAPEVTAKKDAFNILYGTIPLLWANKEGSWRTNRETFLRTYRNTCKLHEAIAGTEMLSHEFVTPDRQVQRTKFNDGTTAIVNFGTAPYTVRMDGKSFQLPQNGWVVRGPRIEQSRVLEDGSPKTTIKTASYSFTEAQ